MSKLFSGKRGQLPTSMSKTDLYFANDTNQVFIGRGEGAPPVEVTDNAVIFPAAEGTVPVAGPQGPAGTNGTNGATGSQGIQGAQGENGNMGCDGDHADATEWVL